MVEGIGGAVSQMCKTAPDHALSGSSCAHARLACQLPRSTSCYGMSLGNLYPYRFTWRLPTYRAVQVSRSIGTSTGAGPAQATWTGIASLSRLRDLIRSHLISSVTVLCGK